MVENFSLFERKTSKSKVAHKPRKAPSKQSNTLNKNNNNSTSLEIRTKLGLSKNHIKILKNCQEVNTAKELMAILEFTNLTKFREKYLNVLLDEYKVPLRNKEGNVIKKEKLDNNGNVITQTKKIDGEYQEVPVIERVTTTKQGYGFFKMSKPDKPNAKDQTYIFTNTFTKLHIGK